MLEQISLDQFLKRTPKTSNSYHEEESIKCEEGLKLVKVERLDV